MALWLFAVGVLIWLLLPLFSRYCLPMFYLSKHYVISLDEFKVAHALPPWVGLGYQGNGVSYMGNSPVFICSSLLPSYLTYLFFIFLFYIIHIYLFIYIIINLCYVVLLADVSVIYFI